MVATPAGQHNQTGHMKAEAAAMFGRRRVAAATAAAYRADPERAAVPGRVAATRR